MGYRFGTISNDNKEVFGNLIDEILHYCSTQEVVQAFRLGEQHGTQDLKLIIGGVKQELKKIDRAQKEAREILEVEKKRQREAEIDAIIDTQEKIKKKSKLQQMIDNMPPTNINGKDLDIDF